MLKNALLALSFANLCFIKVWSRLLSDAGSYFNEFSTVYVSIVADVLLLAAAIWLLKTMLAWKPLRRFQPAARWVFLIALLLPANGVLSLLATFSSFNSLPKAGGTGYFALSLLATALAIFVLVQMRQRIWRMAPAALLVLSPFVLVTFTQATLALSKSQTAVVSAAPAPVSAAPVAARPAKRAHIVWIIFDEMDQRMTYGQRTADLSLPELDRIRNQAVYATNAFPPARLTYMSMPALITGRLVSKVTPAGPSELLVNFGEEPDAVRWSNQPNLFGSARQAGFTTGVVGWCHPYCRVIGKTLTKCKSVGDQDHELSLRGTMVAQFQSLLATAPMVQQVAIPVVQQVASINKIVLRQEREKYILRYKSVLADAIQQATDPDLDLVLIHLPAPHPPGIYDRVQNDFSLEGGVGYADNLALADRALGQLRAAMEANGTWDSSVVLISADHWWRTSMWRRGPFWTASDEKIAGGQIDHRVPFVLKLAGQNSTTTYDQSFNTVVTHDLLLAVLHGDITDAQTATNWLDRNRSIADSPYNLDELLP